MIDLTLEMAQTILSAALAHARAQNLNPLAIRVLDARGVLKTGLAEDGTSLRRGNIAEAKAAGALAFGVGSRTLLSHARDQPYFITAASQSIGGAMIPAPGGVLIRSAEGRLLGAIGISGDSSDHDEACALAGIQAAGLVADPGMD
ncbi:MAG: heme-binding protein [Xanthobacter sp.]